MSETNANTMGDVQQIATALIHESPYQVRKIAGTPELDKSLMELADNIRRHGLINPITVRKTTTADRYECVAGHRRLAACMLNDCETIAAVVADGLGDAAAEEILVAENMLRQDMTTIDEGETCILLCKTRTPAEAAKICQKSERWVYRRLLIDKLSTTAKAVGKTYKWPAAFCEALGKHGMNQQDAMIHEAARSAGAAFSDVLDGTVDTSAAPFFAGALSALGEAEKGVEPLPERKPRKTATAAPKEKPAAPPTPAPEPEKSTEAAQQPQEPSQTENSHTGDQILLRMARRNPLMEMDGRNLVLLIMSPDWADPFEQDYDSAVELLWDRMRMSIERKLTTADPQAAETLAANVCQVLDRIMGASAPEAENDETESEAV